MLQVDVKAAKRDQRGKGAARSLRRAGRTPAVLYGPQMEPQALSLDTHTFTKALFSVHRRNSVINLEVSDDGGEKIHHVVTREIQTDPILDQVLHADFYVISLDEPLVFQVPLRYRGKAKGVDMGGDLVTSLHKVSLKGKALDIPDDIEVDVSGLGPNSELTCGELSLPAGVELVQGKDEVCVAVAGGTE
ncbi:50S ribosomal protein L25 [Desulfurivibrio alkaliphilus]|uniref:Large ribosomal subunit protein bL25 n=1 Tax=Desulfurivibrio alkaliphilus (strain DSM 19089 / UNIQEM U267 / AHT2) TaxID=589865 RepID=D6Z152_DESAT|nr:50S ribosomal protein L25 [Desulfurivibrio alkaliphilus]ADH85307.1 ribosomal 5S rRNA E-loop binding protein Ctc/L25/TL5 [Desulfurivibrio alkaliphilus AHT 2]